MKKKLLEQKKQTQFFLVLCLLFICANTGWSQTVLQETFGSAAVPIANNYNGSTSIPSTSYTTNTSGYTAVGVDANNNGYLNFMPNTTTGANRISVTGVLPTGSSLNGVLHSNTKLVTWTVNMKSSRLSTNAFSATIGYPANKYFNAVVLCATNGNLISNMSSPGTGYAIVVQKSSNNSLSGKASINLIKFTNGIGDVVNESSVVTRLIESPELSQIPSSVTTSNNLSIKVTYNPIIDAWELSYREDPITPTPITFVDPTSGSLTLGGTATDVPTATPMTNFGFVVGLQSTTNTANAYQFDNFQIGLSTAPPYTAPPTVEKRQTLNSSSNPTVANLVAVGTNLKWYSALTGGTDLAPTTALSSANYYVSQTISGTESTRVATQVFIGDTALKTLPLYESFANYTIGDKLVLMNNGVSAALPANAGVGLGSWSITPSTNVTDDVIIATAPTWTNTVLPSAKDSNAITFAGSGIDPELHFTNTTSGSLYSSFVFSAADVATIVASTTTDANYSTPTGFYSFLSESTDPITSVVNTEYSADVMFRKNIATGKFNLGLSKSNNINECVWSPTEYDFGTTQHLIVISYENIGDATATNQVANLWIDPASTTQPAVTLTQNSPTTSVSRNHIDRIKLVQASSTSTPTLIIDEIRVANNWGQALGGASTLGLAKADVSQLKVYPNPVTNGKLFISSNTSGEKQVSVYSVLGQKVLETKTNNNAEINVTPLTKGTYFLKITEEGVSETKKIIIQ